MMLALLYLAGWVVAVRRIYPALHEDLGVEGDDLVVIPETRAR